MEYIRKKYIESVTTDALDISLENHILGNNPEGHDYREIEDINLINCQDHAYIDGVINILKGLKTLGANFVGFKSDLSHHKLNIEGLEIRKATEEEIKIHIDLHVKHEKHRAEMQIFNLYGRISDIKKKYNID